MFFVPNVMKIMKKQLAFFQFCLVVGNGILQQRQGGCPGILSLANGYVDYIRDTSVGSRVLVGCHSGYKIIGNDFFLCQPNFEWKQPGLCSKSIQCSWPANYALVVYFNRKHGSKQYTQEPHTTFNLDWIYTIGGYVVCFVNSK